MNILKIRSNIKLAGPAVQMIETSKILKEDGNEVILVTGGGKMELEFKEYGIPTYVFPELDVGKRNIFKLINIAYKISKIITKYNIDVIHGYNAVSSFIGWIAKLITKRRHIRVYNTVLGVGKESTYKWMPFDKFLAVSNFVQKRLQSYGVAEEKIEVVYNSTINLQLFDPESIDGSIYRQQLGIKSNEIVIGSICHMVEMKGQGTIIQALTMLISKYPNIKLLLVGDGPYKSNLESMVRNNNLENNVTFTGFRRDIPQMISAMDIFCHAPWSETFGMVLIEAMAMEKPVVSTNVGGIPEVVVMGETGILCELGDVKELVTALETYIEDAQRRKNDGIRGKERVVELFSKETLKRVITRVYQEAVE